jgi:hypothetical protein
MIKGRVSVVIPACNERFLQATVDDLLANARGDVEIYAVIDGGPDQPSVPIARVIKVRHEQRAWDARHVQPNRAGVGW